MSDLLQFILLFPLILIVIFAIKYRRALLSVYKLKKHYKEAQKSAEEERARRERVRRQTDDAPSSVEMIDNASLDLEGGEYVEYEEIEDDGNKDF